MTCAPRIPSLVYREFPPGLYVSAQEMALELLRPTIRKIARDVIAGYMAAQCERDFVAALPVIRPKPVDRIVADLNAKFAGRAS